ncbi:MAG TPA: oligosaccharide flippase family protein [Thermoanaerobaculia bacterium]|nr:oligosaccharide flippase family protein [Thermoanaerobaculia bacterium]
MLRRNVIANSVGTLWSTLLAIAVVPVYLKILGIGAYALVGFAATLQTLFLLFDLGLATTTNREMARLAALPDKTEEMRSLLGLLERLYWLAAAVIAAVIFLLAPWIAVHWLHSSEVPAQTVANAIRLMAPVIALQFPFALYQGTLLGLQRHPELNVTLVIGSSIRLLAAVPFLIYVAPAIEAFFVMQIIGMLVQTILARVQVLRALSPVSGPVPAMRLRELARVRRFALGMAAISIAAALVMQIDKVIVSRLLSLEDFGYYTIATSIASGLTILAAPVFASIFPRFSQLVAISDDGSVRELYDRTLQFMAAVIVPITAVLILFSREVTWVWTGNRGAADASTLCLPFLAVALALNAILHVPYALQLAHGWTAPASFQNALGVVVLPVAMIVMGRRYGLWGVAAVYAGFNLLAFFAGLWLVRRFLTAVTQTRAIGSLAALSSVILAIGLRQLELPAQRIQLLAAIMGIVLMTTAVSLIATPAPRRWLLEAATRS